MSSNLVSTERGGQSDGYEDSLKNVNEPHAKQTGVLGGLDTSNEIGDPRADEKAERGEQTAANIRYGQKLSEEGMGGRTDGLESNGANKDGYGNVKSRDDNTSTEETRRQQGYGGGSGVGA